MITVYFLIQNNKLIKNILKGVEVCQRDIEIRRIDIAFNQIFESKKDALRYLSYQKKIRKKYSSEKTNQRTNYRTSIFLVTDSYSAKIYHKGSEYESKNGEKKHHIRINRELKKEYFPVVNEYDDEGNLLKEGLQGFADRILRYEITFRTSAMSRLYKDKIFAKDCINFKQMRKEYNEVRKVLKRCERREKKLMKDELIKDDKSIYSKERRKLYEEYHSLPNGLKKNHTICNKILNKSNSFRLDVGEDEYQRSKTIIGLTINNQGQPNIPTNAFFTKELLDLMFDRFLDFMEQFNIRSLDDLDEAMIKVAKYNQLVDEMNERCPEKKQEQKLRENTIKKHLMLMQNNTLDELVEIGVISLRGKYDILSKMKKIGIKKSHIKTDMNLIPENDFKKYYEVVKANFSKLLSNRRNKN